MLVNEKPVKIMIGKRKKSKGQQGREKPVNLKSQGGHRRRLREKFIKYPQSPIRKP